MLNHLPASRRTSRRVLTGLLLAVGLALTATAASASGTAEEIANFSTGDPATDPGTEGIAVTGDGTVYVTANNADGGQVWTLAPGADTPAVLTTLIPPTGGAGFGALGIHIDGDDLLVATHTLADPELNGVWRVNIATGAAEHIAGTEVIGLPNDITTAGPNIYVTDSVTGAVWVIDGDDVRPFAQDPLLEGVGALVPGVPIGANGIDSFGNRLYVANLEKGLVVEIKINGRDAGVAKLYATVDGAPDGLEVNHRGQPHIVSISTNALIRVSPDGNTTIIEDSTVLDAPASVTFGKGRGHKTAYVVNFSISEGFPGVLLPSDVGPSVVAVHP